MTRPDARPKVEGRVEYGPDLEASGMLWGALVLAPSAHGDVRTLDLAPARQVPGVVAAIGPKEVRALVPKGGGDPERPIFPDPEILYRFQPVAAVAAETLAAARAGVRAVRIEVDERPVAADLEEIFPEWPGPEAEHAPHVIAHVHAREGDLAAAFTNADLLYSETYRTSGIQQVALEPHACLASVTDGRWSVRTSTQSPFAVREDVSTLLAVPESSVVVDGTWVGGGFGGKASAFLEPYALLLAAASGRPVKLELSYREEFLLARSTLPSVIRLDTAVRDGAITGRRVRLLLDAGASLPGRDFATGFAIGFLSGPYRVGAFELEGYAVRTNKPPFGPHRAPFAPQCAFAAESHMDGLARRLGADPVDFRLAHAWTEGDRTLLGQRVGPFGLREALGKAKELSERWRRDLPAHHGLGIGCGFWSTGTGAGGEARLRLSDRELVIEQVEHDIGSGSVLGGLTQVAVRVLGLPEDVVRVEAMDTAHAPFDSGVFGSRTVGALGQAVEQAARTIATTLAERWGATEPVRLARRRDRIVALAGRRSRSVVELFTPEERAQGGLVAEGKHYGRSGEMDESRVLSGTFYPYTDFTASVNLCEVEVDRQTGRVRPIRSAAFLDVGVALDPAMVQAQVEGAVAMGLGEALTEESLWTPEGRLLNPGLLDYRVPTLGEVPPIEVRTIEGFRGAGPFGAKGVGEPAIIPVAAAVANAIADATGARVLELPATPERVARVLKLV
ncbi:MAG: xanthine dehydrogenase family protein molybdopterin-binding subunit [Thermoplasmata archaeon]